MNLYEGAQQNVLDKACWNTICRNLIIRQGTEGNQLSPNLGMLRFLKSSLNTSASSNRINISESSRQLERGDGKMYRVKRRFLQRQASNIHVNQKRFYCKTDGVTVPYIEDYIDIGYDHVSKPLLLDDAMLRCIEEGREQWANDRILEHLRTFMNDFGTKVSKRVSDLNNGFIGSHAGESTPQVKDIPLYMADGKTINPVGVTMLEEYAKRAQYNETPVMIGGTKLDMYTSVSSFSSASQLGFDATRSQLQNAIYRDNNVGLHLGDDDNFLAIVPGALQLVTFVRHVGDFTHETDKQKRRTMVEPYMGMTVDVIINVDDCGDDVKTSMQWAICWDVVGYPKCHNEDPCYKYITDVFMFRIVCSDTGICDFEPDTCRQDIALERHNIQCTTGYAQCIVTANAAFSNSASTKCYFTIEENSGAVSQLSINGLVNGLANAPANGYDLTDAAQLQSFKDDVNMILSAMNKGSLIQATDDGTNMTIVLEVSCDVAEIKLNNYTASKKEAAVVCFDAGMSTPITGGTITNMSWTIGTTTITGTPEDLIGQAGFYGCVNKFCVDQSLLTNGQSVSLTITDNTGGISTFTDVINFQ